MASLVLKDSGKDSGKDPGKTLGKTLEKPLPVTWIITGLGYHCLHAYTLVVIAHQHGLLFPFHSFPFVSKILSFPFLSFSSLVEDLEFMTHSMS